MNKVELIKKIMLKKEFSGLPKKDVELVFERFDNENHSDEEKVKFTRNILRKVFSSFTSQKILSLKNKDEEWILKKHLSTRERYPNYLEIYQKLLKNMGKNLSVIDLGSGVNGFSYNYFKKLGFNINYLGIEAIKQLVDLMDYYFKKEKMKAKAVHLSLLELEKVKDLIKKLKKPKIVFLFKTIDSLEVLDRDYSKKLISEIVPLTDKLAISFATRSMVRKKKFNAQRNWILNFLKDNFEILDDFQLSGERYVVFKAVGKHL